VHASLPFREPAAPRDDWPSQAGDIAEIARSQWGLWDDELDGITQAQLLESYIHRKEWEANLLAVAVMRLLSGGGGTERPRTGKQPEPVGRLDRVSSDAFLGMMGMKLNGHKPS
jgi:hypothetical protein